MTRGTNGSAWRLFGGVLVVGGLTLLSQSAGAADRQFFKVGGGGGIAFLDDPTLDLPIFGSAGGFIGYRANDNVSIEGGFYFARGSRVYTVAGIPVDENTPVDVDRTSLTRTHYNAEGTLVINLGRRRQFHPFFLGGGGVVRIEDERVLVQVADPTLPITTRVSDHVPSVHFGVGFDLYFLYNVAARSEIRFTFPDLKYSQRSTRLIFGATYFF